MAYTPLISERETDNNSTRKQSKMKYMRKRIEVEQLFFRRRDNFAKIVREHVTSRFGPKVVNHSFDINAQSTAEVILRSGGSIH